MPMYRRKPEEWRQAAEETRVDIAHWAGLDEDDVKVGNYYDRTGRELTPAEFDARFEEAE